MPYLVFIDVCLIFKCELNFSLLVYTKEHNALSIRSELPFLSQIYLNYYGMFLD